MLIGWPAAAAKKKNMKIGITGGSGFIGSRLRKLLEAEGHEALVLDRSANPPVEVTDRSAVLGSLEGAEAIYHLAAEHRDDVRPPKRYYEVNVGGAENVAKAAKAHGIQTIVFTSTVAVYGLNAGESREEDAPHPFNDYGRSKLEAEGILDAWADAKAGRSLTTARLTATFGPGNRGNIYTLANQIARGRFFMVGEGRNRKSVAYVENVAAFLKHCLGLGAGRHLFNYADKPDLSMRDMVRDIRDALGLAGMPTAFPYAAGLAGGMFFDALARLTSKKFPISAVRVRKFCADTVVNAEKAHGLARFEAPCSLSEGLRNTIRAEFPKEKPEA